MGSADRRARSDREDTREAGCAIREWASLVPVPDGHITVRIPGFTCVQEFASSAQASFSVILLSSRAILEW